MLDPSGKLLARTTNAPGDDPLWEEHVMNGYFSEETMDFLKNVGLYKQLLGKRGPVLLKNSALTCKRIICGIELHNKVIAYLIVMESNRQFKQEDYDIIVLLSKAIGLSKNRFYQNFRSAACETLVYDLLDGNIHDDEIINSRVESLSWRLGNCLCILVADIRLYDNTNTLWITIIEIQPLTLKRSTHI